MPCLRRDALIQCAALSIINSQVKAQNSQPGLVSLRLGQRILRKALRLPLLFELEVALHLVCFILNLRLEGGGGGGVSQATNQPTLLSSQLNF